MCTVIRVRCENHLTRVGYRSIMQSDPQALRWLGARPAERRVSAFGARIGALLSAPIRRAMELAIFVRNLFGELRVAQRPNPQSLDPRRHPL